MLVNPITGVLNGCRHRKGTELMLKKFLCIQNQEKHIVLVKQYKTKILILVFYLKLSLDASKPLPKGQNLTLTGAIVKFSSHLISSQSLNLGGRRGTADDVATIPPPHFPDFRCSQGIYKPYSHPFLDVIVPSRLLSSFPSCSFHCPLQICLRHARGFEFPFLYHG